MPSLGQYNTIKAPRRVANVFMRYQLLLFIILAMVEIEKFSRMKSILPLPFQVPQIILQMYIR